MKRLLCSFLLFTLAATLIFEPAAHAKRAGVSRKLMGTQKPRRQSEAPKGQRTASVKPDNNSWSGKGKGKQSNNSIDKWFAENEKNSRRAGQDTRAPGSGKGRAKKTTDSL